MGPVKKAAEYFFESPMFASFKEYSNPADFLADVSGCQLRNTNVGDGYN